MYGVRFHFLILIFYNYRITNLYQDLRFLEQDLSIVNLEIQGLNKSKKVLESKQKDIKKVILKKLADITNLETTRRDNSKVEVNKILNEFLPEGNYKVNAILNYDPSPEKNNELKIEFTLHESEQQGPCTFTLTSVGPNELLTFDQTTLLNCEYILQTNPDVYNGIILQPNLQNLRQNLNRNQIKKITLSNISIIQPNGEEKNIKGNYESEFMDGSTISLSKQITGRQVPWQITSFMRPREMRYESGGGGAMT